MIGYILTFAGGFRTGTLLRQKYEGEKVDRLEFAIAAAILVLGIILPF